MTAAFRQALASCSYAAVWVALMLPMAVLTMNAPRLLLALALSLLVASLGALRWAPLLQKKEQQPR